MIDPGRRRFTMADGMILVASAALGLALTRWALPWVDGLYFFRALVSEPPAPGWSARVVIVRLTTLLVVLAPMALGAEAGYLALRLRAPRPRWRRLARQPAMVAAVVVLVVAGLGAAAQWAWARLDNRAPFPSRGAYNIVMVNAVAMIAQRAGSAVLVAWLALAPSGRRRAGRGGLDRLGRALGWYWIATAALASYFVDRAIWWGVFLELR